VLHAGDANPVADVLHAASIGDVFGAMLQPAVVDRALQARDTVLGLALFSLASSTASSTAVAPWTTAAGRR